MPFIVLGVVAAIVFVQEGQRRIPIQYAKRVIGRRMTQGGQTYLPLRVNMAGVIPVIFAASVMAIPPTIGQLLGQNRNNFATDLANFFNPQGWHYVLGESILIILFTYFYTAVTFNPVDQAENLKKYGGFIPGVRPGRPTAEFLDRILARLTFPGALFLAAVAALPTILINQTSANFFFGGTSILIVIGVALDTMKQLEAQLMMRNYEGFLKVGGRRAVTGRSAPRGYASAPASSRRVWMSSLRYALRRWYSTVFGVTNRAWAISRLRLAGGGELGDPALGRGQRRRAAEQRLAPRRAPVAASSIRARSPSATAPPRRPGRRPARAARVPRCGGSRAAARRRGRPARGSSRAAAARRRQPHRRCAGAAQRPWRPARTGRAPAARGSARAARRSARRAPAPRGPARAPGRDRPASARPAPPCRATGSSRGSRTVRSPISPTVERRVERLARLGPGPGAARPASTAASTSSMSCGSSSGPSSSRTACGPVELAALDQAQRVVRGGRARELVPAVAPGVARQLEVGERVGRPRPCQSSGSPRT